MILTPVTFLIPNFLQGYTHNGWQGYQNNLKTSTPSMSIRHFCPIPFCGDSKSNPYRLREHIQDRHSELLRKQRFFFCWDDTYFRGRCAVKASEGPSQKWASGLGWHERIVSRLLPFSVFRENHDRLSQSGSDADGKHNNHDNTPPRPLLNANNKDTADVALPYMHAYFDLHLGMQVEMVEGGGRRRRRRRKRGKATESNLGTEAALTMVILSKKVHTRRKYGGGWQHVGYEHHRAHKYKWAKVDWGSIMCTLPRIWSWTPMLQF